MHLTIDETKFEYPWTVDSSMATLGGTISPVGLQRISIVTSEMHLEAINLTVNRLIADYGLSWILLSLSVKIFKPIYFGDDLIVKTHHTNRRGVIYRRDFEFFRNGERVAVAASFSSLMDVKARRICTDRHLLESLSVPQENEILFEADSRHKVKAEDFCELETLAVRSAWLDPIGHVNNLRYAEFAHNCLPDELESRLCELSELSIFFTGELKKGDELKLMTKSGGEAFEVLGIRLSDGRPAFTAKMTLGL